MLNSIINLLKSLIEPISSLATFFIGKRYGATTEKIKHFENAARLIKEKRKNDKDIDIADDRYIERLRKKWNRNT